MPRYAPSNPPTTLDIQQLERWLREEYEQVRGSTDDIYTWADFALQSFVAAGYGSIGQDVIGPFAIGPTWNTFNLWDIELISAPSGIQHNLPNGFIVTAEGIWQINIKISLEFAELNAGRRIQMRFWNETQQTGGVVFNYAIGRNTDGANLNLSFLAEIDEVPAASDGIHAMAINDDVRIQIRSDDTFTGVQAIGSIWDMHHVSEWKGYDPLQNIQTGRAF